MRFEPPVDHARLVEAVRAAYDLAADNLSFIPVGFAAVCYALECADGTRRFLKLWPDTRTDPDAVVQRDTMLRLPQALHERQVGLRVPYPLATRAGSLWAAVPEGSFAIFPWLPGTIPHDWTAPLQDEWARTLATIHRATPLVADVLPPRETFAMSFEADLQRGLHELDRIGPGDRPGLRALRDLMLPRRAEVLEQIARLRALQQVVRRLDSPFVLCHTDFGGDNVLLDDAGHLAVLDWDEASLAPPEYDLFEAGWLDVDLVLRAYVAAGG